FICPHEQTRVENAVPASCTVNGYTGDTVCAVCGTVLEYGATVFAPGHSPAVSVPAKAPTCLEEGLTAEYACSVCGEVTTAARVLTIVAHPDADGDGECDVCMSPVGCTVYGVCGDGIFWCVDDGTLVISGEGSGYAFDGGVPWDGCKNDFDCVFVRAGVTGFDLSSVEDCAQAERVFVPQGTAVVGSAPQRVISYTFDGGVAGLSGAGECAVYDVINVAYELLRLGAVSYIRFDELTLAVPDGGELVYDVLKNGKIVDEDHFSVPSGTAVSDFLVRPLGYRTFNAVFDALGANPDKNLILSIVCADLLPDEFRADAGSYTEQIVVRFEDEPGPDPEEPEEEHLNWFQATLAAILGVFKKLVKLLKGLFK
ncbi:MAG: hypothetical protein K6C36_02115, partial [Clostridia bacterium]|nr:hypothetical protein [Clostridia bacterium]